MNPWIVMTTLIAIPIALVLAGQLGLLSGQAPEQLGVQGTQLQPPSTTRNSVSSQADRYPDHPQRAYAHIDPLPLKGATPAAAMAQLARTLSSEPGVSIVINQNGYLRATARTPWLGFVDDLEFWHNPEKGVIDLRSASRLGREDFGTNRNRIERIRAAYLALSDPTRAESLN
jgi:uncharacterized protein (DUF1499 family)